MTAGRTRPSGLLSAIESNRLLARRAFWTYAIVLFVGTHWPKLDVRVPGIERPDLIIHLAIFGLWYLLFWMTAYAGPIRSRVTALVAAFVACGYSAIDERLQAIPFVGRTCAWDDLEANWTGIGLACIVVLVVLQAARAHRG